MLLPYINNPNDTDLLFKPVSQELVIVKSDEYVEKEAFDQYLRPVNFDILSIVISYVSKYQKFTDEQWDLSGYSMPSEGTFNNVFCFLTSLPDSYLYHLTADNIEPTPYGTFVVDFKNGFHILSIEIGKDKIGFYREFNNTIESKSDGVVFDANETPKPIMDAFSEMFS